MDEQRIVIRHMNSSKANQTEEFPVKDNSEITAGREADCKIRYDSNRDDLVSRRHAKITVEKAEPIEVAIADLGSSNGTFVNKQRVFNKMALHPGDVVQLGPGGPEFQFDLNPRPNGAKATRMANVPGTILPPTREAAVPTTVTAPPPRTAAASTNPPVYTPSGSTAVGKATVERMITQNKKQTRTTMVIAGLVLLAIVGGVAGYLLTRPKPQPITKIVQTGPSGKSSSTIAHQNTAAVVYIEVAWSLIDADNGRTLSQVYFPNATKDKRGKMVKVVPEAGATLPVFIAYKGNVEPILSTDDGGGQYVPISESASGSGFVVSNDGFILTNRHVAEGWNTSWSGWSEHQDPAGFLLTPTDKGISLSVIGANQFPGRWVPANAKVIFQGNLNMDNLRIMQDPLGFAKAVQGRDDVLNVTFAGNRIRTPAKVARSSDHVDVSMIKVDLPRSLPKVELNDNYETMQPGAQVVVMGYPGVSPQIVQVANSSDIFNSQQAVATIPDPTISDGNVGRVIRNGEHNTDDEATVSTYGDYYQLAINTTGEGNSGGPVFDEDGKVIGIFTAGRHIAGAQVSFAVPIRYGMELMGITIGGK